MTVTSRGQGLARFLERLRALFNLNDPGWGRSAGGRSNGEQPAEGNAGAENRPPSPPAAPSGSDHGQRPPSPPPGGGQQPPDLGELIADLNRKLGGLFGGGGNNGRGNRPRRNGGAGGGFKPPAISMGLVGVVAVVLLGLWLASGFFVVQEGHRAAVLHFGKHVRSVDAGLRYRLPAPIGRHEMVDMRIQSIEIGRDALVPETGLTQFAMLTQDENIVEVLFTVQYRIVNAENWLFNAERQTDTISAVAASAVRQIVGNMSMDDAIARRREEIAPTLRRLMQTILDRYGLGVEVVAINMQSSGVRPPESVRDAFEDVLRAEQERVRSINEATAYANDVIPRAEGEADRILEEAHGYRLQVIAEAEGDADRFSAIWQEYARAPEVTRERMYLETMEEIYRNSNKVLVDDSNGSNLLYLPLDKLMEQNRQRPAPSAAAAAPVAAQPQTAPASAPPSTAPRRPTRDAR